MMNTEANMKTKRSIMPIELSILCLSICAAAIIGGCGENGGHPDTAHSHRVDIDPGTGWHIVTLSAENTADPSRSVTARIAVEGGSNLFSLEVGGTEFIDAVPEIENLVAPGRGTPILFPTPNRVRDATYRFRGETHHMSFPGETRSHWLHGLVIDDTAWSFEEPMADDDGVSVTTVYVIDRNNPRFPAFPFPCELRVTFSLSGECLRIGYEVENTGEGPLGFGFGLHPFWKVIGGKENCLIQVDVPWHMEAVELLPTGKLEPVDGTGYDLREPVRVSELSLDDVYYGAEPASTVRVIYESLGMEIRQKATADFTHIVVYTPDSDFFCVENQTCSTDAHNLYDKGFVKESHLQIVEAGETTGGHVDYEFVFGE